MDWVRIVEIVIGFIAGGGMLSLINLKSTKKKEESSAIGANADAAKGMVEYAKSLQEFSQKYTDSLQEELKETRMEMSYQTKRLNELDKKVTILTRTVKDEIQKKRYAERLICFREECKERIPNLGQFKTDSPEIDDKSETLRNIKTTRDKGKEIKDDV